MNEIKNQEDDEIKNSREWIGGAMKGKWDGKGYWYEKDGKWNGHGTWEGGMINGKWEVNGKWKSVGDGVGTWEGEGKVTSDKDFMVKFETTVVSIGFILSIVAAALSLFVQAYEPKIAVIIVFAIALLTALTKHYLKSTTKGKLWLKGSWKDIEEYRILDITGDWKLGYHRGIIKGKMKDPKPRDSKAN